MVLSVHINLSCKPDPVIESSPRQDSRGSWVRRPNRAQGISVIRRESTPSEQLAQEIAVGRKCCTENSRKVAAGVVMTALIALSWVGAAHCLKGTYNRPRNRTRLVDDPAVVSGQSMTDFGTASNQSDDMLLGNGIPDDILFDAPFFTTWLCTAFNVFFLPVFLIGRQCWSRGTTCRVIM
ncbi:solute carrier family 35 member F3-like [Tropilaelaps mercedesae]|uniref:Solute carrier family 35 member F3-like n=1 Tax=Tropilaelaps mercedesae TaxID=418985 RepID=A0A1V9X047_9ACAR|nr:solute carrier family 35 member F3-like [Tropilaelaps mercedesae]